MYDVPRKVEKYLDASKVDDGYSGGGGEISTPRLDCQKRNNGNRSAVHQHGKKRDQRETVSTMLFPAETQKTFEGEREIRIGV